MNRKRHKLILDFSRGTVKVAETECAHGRVIFHDMALIPMPSGPTGENPLHNDEMAARIREVVVAHSWKGMETICLLSRSTTSTQTLNFPPMTNEELRHAILLKLKETLHFDISEACFDFHKVGQTKVDGKTEILTTVVAAHTSSVRRAISILRESGLEPVNIGAAPQALANLVYQTHLCDNDEAAIHVDIGSASTILNLLEGRILRFSRELDVAGEAFTRALMRPIITVKGPAMLNHEEAERIKILAGYPFEDEELDLPRDIQPSDILPLLEQVAQKLFAEIHRSSDFLRGILNRKQIDRIILSGPGSRMRNLDTIIEENLEIPVKRVHPVEKAIEDGLLEIRGNDDVSRIGFSAVLGHALGHNQPINLLPAEELIAQRIQRVARLRKMLVPPVAAAVAAFALVMLPISATYTHATTQLQNEADNLQNNIDLHRDHSIQESAATAMIRSLEARRGQVVHWAGVFKELSNLLPENVRISFLSAQRMKNGTQLRLATEITPQAEGFEESVSALMTLLDRSPFFDNVHILNARKGETGEVGRVEFELVLVAGWTHLDPEQGVVAWKP